ncbi:Derlin 1 [Allomyces javanicus]|nr:Derlin 1 [Allomyces javanicus]
MSAVNAPPRAGNPVSDFIWGLPPLTRALFVSTVAVSLAANFALVDPYHLLLVWPLVLKKYQVWRLLSCFFVGKLGFNWAMNLYFLYQHSLSLERGRYNGRTADYAFLVAFVMVCSLIAGWFFEFVVLSEPLMMALLYLWAQANGAQPVQFMFGMTFTAQYLPWVLAGWDLLMTGAFPLVKLCGIVIGHAFYYLDELYPAAHNGRRLISTPGFFYRMFPAGAGFTASATGGYAVHAPRAPFGRPEVQQAAGSGLRYRWGSGQRLGDG